MCSQRSTVDPPNDAQLALEPGTRKAPITDKGFGHFIDAQSAEKTHLEHPALPLVVFREAL
jgi:hypothetical protein